MLDHTALLRYIPQTLDRVDVDWPFEQDCGKVRDWFDLPDGRRLIATTDRLSAFDRILTTIPFKGQVLNQLSAFWFEKTSDIIPNHIIDVPDPNVSLVHECEPLPVEVVVRGYITGVTRTALWYRYSLGKRQIYGYEFPDGMRKNQQLPDPIITPTTKGRTGEHDERITCAEVVERGLLDEETWERIQDAALAIFERGQEIARQSGLILVDTKYEFGRAADGTLMLIDEVHTPDSSRFWMAESYEELIADGLEPENFDKEFLRLWYAERGYRGSGEPPEATEDLIVQVSQRYIALYEKLTDQTFEPGAYPAGPRIAKVLERIPGGSVGGPNRTFVVIIMGSPSDAAFVERITEALDGFDIRWERHVASAHKVPRHVLDILETYEANPRPKVYITVAGRSNALSGLVDAQVTAPVIACPPYSEKFAGGDLLSSLRMPSGVAPATVLEPESAALLAAKILGLAEPHLSQRVQEAQDEHRQRLLDADAETLRGSQDP